MSSLATQALTASKPSGVTLKNPDPPQSSASSTHPLRSRSGRTALNGMMSVPSRCEANQMHNARSGNWFIPEEDPKQAAPPAISSSRYLRQELFGSFPYPASWTEAK